MGWDQALLGLDLYLANGTTFDPDESEAWQLSEEGKAFARQSSEAWCRASIEFGTDPAAARAAADRTTAFYTGEGAEPSDSSEA